MHPSIFLFVGHVYGEITFRCGLTLSAGPSLPFLASRLIFLIRSHLWSRMHSCSAFFRLALWLWLWLFTAPTKIRSLASLSCSAWLHATNRCSTWTPLLCFPGWPVRGFSSFTNVVEACSSPASFLSEHGIPVPLGRCNSGQRPLLYIYVPSVGVCVLRCCDIKPRIFP